MKIKNYIIIGATGIGKTDFSEQLAKNFNGEIVNADSGQMYSSISIGTAKPDWKNSKYKHHMFDIIDEPIDFTVSDWRRLILRIVSEINAKGKPAIIVGGSHFYIQSLLFPPMEIVGKTTFTGGDWNQLQKIDPQRASCIHPNDQYRIDRALGLYYATGKKPSEYEPIYNPPWPYELISLNRTKDDLYRRIVKRYDIMIEQGWFAEAKQFKDTLWQDFIKKKGFIGYSELMDSNNPEDVREIIIAKTWQYAKRQQTFIKSLLKKLCIQNQVDLEIKIKLIQLTK